MILTGTSFISIRLKFISFLLVTFLCLPIVQAQINQLDRFEILLSEQDENENYQVSSLEEKGLLLSRRLIGKTEDIIELIKIDTALHETWKGYITIPKENKISHIRMKDTFVFILMKSIQSTNFQIVSIKIEDGNYGIANVKNLIPFNPTDFVITGTGVMIGGYFNYRPLVLYFNFKSQLSKILPGFFYEMGELTQIKPYPDGTVDILVSAKNWERENCIWVRTYNEDGDLIKTIILEPEVNRNLIFGRAVKMPNGAQVVAGVYGGRNVEYSRGIFVAEINPFGEYVIKYHNFGDLENFFNYMTAKREKRVKERIERRKIKGKKIKFNYRFLVHEVMPYQNSYVMLGEAFYPRYTYTSGRGNIYGFYSNSLMRGERIFDGYQYTHAIVIGFNSSGNLVWDNSFEINDVKTFELQQMVKIAPRDQSISLFYLHKNLVRSKIIQNNEVLEGETTDPLKNRFDFDVVKERDTESSKLDYWYEHHFFASGTQIVRNKASVDKAYRKVFFIVKLAYP